MPVIIINAIKAPTISYSPVVLSDNPIAYYQLNESTPPFVDVINGYNLSAGLSPTFDQPPLVAEPNAKSVFFPNISQTRLFQNANTFDFIHQTGIFALELWVQIPAAAASTYQFFIGTGADNVSVSWDFSLDPNDYLRGYIHKDTTMGTEFFMDTTPNAITRDQPNHIVFTGDGTTATIYINGVSAGTGSLVGKTGGALPACGDVQIGQHQTCWNGSWNYPGHSYIDQVAVYNTHLTSDRVLAHYNAGI